MYNAVWTTALICGAAGMVAAQAQAPYAVPGRLGPFSTGMTQDQILSKDRNLMEISRQSFGRCYDAAHGGRVFGDRKSSAPLNGKNRPPYLAERRTRGRVAT